MAVIIHVGLTKAIILIGPLVIFVSQQHIHIVRSRAVRVVVNPVFGRRMLVAEERRWQTWNRILHCGDAVAFGGLSREEFDSVRVADPGGAIAVEFDVIGKPFPLVSDDSRSEDGFCASKRVAGEGDAVVGVFFMEFHDGLYNRFADASP